MPDGDPLLRAAILDRERWAFGLMSELLHGDAPPKSRVEQHSAEVYYDNDKIPSERWQWTQGTLGDRPFVAFWHCHLRMVGNGTLLDERVTEQLRCAHEGFSVSLLREGGTVFVEAAGAAPELARLREALGRFPASSRPRPAFPQVPATWPTGDLRVVTKPVEAAPTPRKRKARTKPGGHRGEYRWHDDDCLCKLGGVEYCNRNGSVWSCCGATNREDPCTR